MASQPVPNDLGLWILAPFPTTEHPPRFVNGGYITVGLWTRDGFFMIESRQIPQSWTWITSNKMFSKGQFECYNP